MSWLPQLSLFGCRVIPGGTILDSGWRWHSEFETNFLPPPHSHIHVSMTVFQYIGLYEKGALRWYFYLQHKVPGVGGSYKKNSLVFSICMSLTKACRTTSDIPLASTHFPYDVNNVSGFKQSWKWYQGKDCMRRKWYMKNGLERSRKGDISPFLSYASQM